MIIKNSRQSASSSYEPKGIINTVTSWVRFAVITYFTDLITHQVGSVLTPVELPPTKVKYVQSTIIIIQCDNI